MKAHGDIPASHRDLIDELEKLEKWYYEHGSSIPLLSASKGMVCIAHDYYHMDMEEEGDRLLKLAEKTCPGYFYGPIHVHIRNNYDFACLIRQINKTLGVETMESLGFKYE